MKNTTFRKKALLSSVAMLLVALVALGSATFAWFTANPNADASGLALKTTAASGLVIRTDSDPNWSHDALFDAVQDGVDANNVPKYKANTEIRDLQPVSQNQTDGTFVTTAALNSGAYGRDTGDTATNRPAAAISGIQSGFYKENVYFRLSDGSKAADNAVINLTGVSITGAPNASMLGCIRVAIAKPNGEVIATYATNTTDANGVLKTDGSQGAFTKLEAVGDGKTEQVYSGALTVNSDIKTAPYVTVFAYLDGQDTNCFSDNVGEINAAQIVTGITVNFSLASAN